MKWEWPICSSVGKAYSVSSTESSVRGVASVFVSSSELRVAFCVSSSEEGVALRVSSSEVREVFISIPVS